jgi:hypothetical protein
LKLLKTFSNVFEIKIAKQMLEAHDITSEIDGLEVEGTRRVSGENPNFKLLVKNKDFESALRLLDRVESPAKKV